MSLYDVDSLSRVPSLSTAVLLLNPVLEEFIDAAKEEEYGLQKIMEAYDKRIMNQSLS